MCYFNGLKVTHTEWLRLMALEKEIKDFKDQFRVLQGGFEYKNYPIVKPVNGGADIEIEMAHWRFISPWTKTMAEANENSKKFTTLNAQGENLLTSKLYKDAALKRRCLVPSSGFYEWRHYKPAGAKKEEKYPYYIQLTGKEYFYMAGIYQQWTDRSTGETMDTFAIVTTKANSLMEQVHNTKMRMPTILPEPLALEWIQDGLTEDRITELATYQYSAAEMIAHPIYKDFKGIEDPTAACEYAELPALVF